MAEEEQNRNEAATAFKLEEARKRGSVPKSNDTNSFVMLLAAVLALHFWGSSMADREMLLFHALLSNAHQYSFQAGDMARTVAGVLAQSLIIAGPFFVLLVLFAILSNFAQTGPVFSFVPLKPDWDRINPVAGFKRLFSMRLLMESIKTVLKFLLLGAVLYQALAQVQPLLISAMGMDPAGIGHLLLPKTTSLIAKLLVAFAFIAALDLVFSRWEYARRLRMSRREIREEVKRREGDPRIKSRLRELQREALKRARSLGKVKDADVVVTNPTRLAVAIKYDRNLLDAPVVVAKGAGFLAGRIREQARRAQVPIIENKPLARALFRSVAIDHAVPAEHYGTVARILLWVFAMRQGKRERGYA